MPTASFPTRAGRAAQILQVAEGYKEQAVAEAKGQSARFLKVYDEYKKAPDVTRQRIYLETMERILGGSEKLVYDGGGSAQSIVPYLPLSELTPRRPPAAPATASRRGRHAMRSPVAGVATLILLFCRHYRRLQLGLHRFADRASARGPARRAGARRHRARPELQGAVHRHRHQHRQAHPRSGKSVAGSHRFRSEAAGGRRLRPLPHQERAALLSEHRLDPGRQHPAHHAVERVRCAACWARSPSSTWCATNAKR